MRARWWVSSLIVVAAASPRVHAQSASAQAQSLFDDGQRLLQAGKLAEACAAFESSQKLEPAVATLLNLADCREQNHQLATAWAAFVDANRMARTTGNEKLARVATTHAHKLEARLSKLTISVPADHQVPGLEVLRGSERVDPAGWNHALPIDGGTYTISARAPGRTPWAITRTIKVESDAQTVEIPKLADAKPGVFAGAHAGTAAALPAPLSDSPGVASSAGSPGVAPSAKPSAGSPGVASSAKPSAGSPGVATSAKPTADSPGAASSAKPSAGSTGPASSAKPSAGSPAAASSAKPDAGNPAAARPTGSGASSDPSAPRAGAASPGSAPPPAVAARSADAASHGAPRSPVADASSASETTPAVDQPQAGHFPRRYIWPITLGVGALAMGGTALGFKIAGDHKYDDSVATNLRAMGPNDPLRTQAEALHSQANTRLYVAEGLGVAAIGCAGAAVYLSFRSRSDTQASTTAVLPVASPSVTGLAVVGSW
jgi:hypothetical protein